MTRDGIFAAVALASAFGACVAVGHALHYLSVGIAELMIRRSGHILHSDVYVDGTLTVVREYYSDGRACERVIHHIGIHATTSEREFLWWKDKDGVFHELTPQE
jgi:hypothetical protein